MQIFIIIATAEFKSWGGLMFFQSQLVIATHFFCCFFSLSISMHLASFQGIIHCFQLERKIDGHLQNILFNHCRKTDTV